MRLIEIKVEYCAECPFYNESYCRNINHSPEIIGIDIFEDFPEWCPLEEEPNR